MPTNHDNPQELVQRLKFLIEANQSLAAIESFDEIISRLLNLAKEVTGAEASSFLVYNPKRDVLEFTSANDDVLGDEATDILKDAVELKMGEGLAGWVAQHREPVIIKDVRQDNQFFKSVDDYTGFVTRNLLGVPVLYGDQLLGVIEVLNSKHKLSFDRTDQEILSSFANLAAVAIIRARLIEEQISKQKLQIQMEAASKIQTLFWPSPPRIGGDSHLWGVSIPASFAGGDLYDWIPMPDKSWLIYVADVSDKGLPAALIMTALWSRIRSEAIQHQQVSHLLAAVNEAMVELLSDEGFFASVIMAKYDPGTGRVTMATAGHLPPLWLCEGVLRPPPLVKSVSLGVVPGARFEESELQLAPGDALLFMTDGVTEAIDRQENLFGQAGIDRFVAAHQGPPWGQGLVAEVQAHSVGVAAFDDLTVVEIWRDP